MDNFNKEGKPEFTDAEITAAFRFIDLDHNNFVGAAEIRHILVCMGEMITDEEIDMMIRYNKHTILHCLSVLILLPLHADEVLRGALFAVVGCLSCHRAASCKMCCQVSLFLHFPL